jgi:hypothetical protein
MSNDKQQTAVEILVDSLIELGYLHSNEFGQSLKVTEVIKQAKEMEKEQIMDTFNQGYREAELNLNEIVNKGDISKFYDAQNYYNETFNQQKQ